MALSAVKMSREHEDAVIRWFNLDSESRPLEFTPNFNVEAIYESDILERRHEAITSKEINQSESQIKQKIGKAQIVTYALQLK